MGCGGCGRRGNTRTRRLRVDNLVVAIDNNDNIDNANRAVQRR
jgi:hypothetical protein